MADADLAASIADLENIGRGSILKIVGAAANTFFSLALILIVTRGFGQIKAGTFFAATTLFLLIGQAAEIGADEAMLRFIPALRVSGRRGDVRRLAAKVLKPVVVSSMAAAVATLLLIPLLAGALTAGGDEHTIVTLLYVLLPFIPVIALGEVVLAGTRGFQTMGPSVLIYDIGLSALQAALPMFVWLVKGPSLLWLVVAWVVPYLFVLAVGAFSFRRQLRRDGADLLATKDELVPEYWRFVAPRATARLCQYGLRRIDVLIVAVLSGPRDAAIYTAITRFITVGTVGVQAIQQVAQPKLAELIHLRDRRRSLEVFQTSTVWLMTVSWPVYALFGVFASVLLHSFGHGYVGGSTALAVLCGSQLLTVATGPVDVALVMEGRSTTSLINQTIALAIDVLLCLALVPTLGVTGAAVARILALQWNNLVPGVQVYRDLGLHPFSRAALCVGAAALVGVGGSAVLVRWWSGVGFGPFLLATAIGGFVYGTVLIAIRRIAKLDALVSSLRPGLRRAT